MRRTAFIIALLLITPVLAIETSASEYNKGDSIIITTSGLNLGQTYEIIGSLANKTLFTHAFTATSDTYDYNYTTSFLDPAGTWTIMMGEEITNATINPTRDSSTLLVTYLSPVSRSYERTSKFNIEVNLTSGGDIVTGAKVFTFNQFGEKIALTEKGDGAYTIPYELPLNAPAGDRTITVMAEKNGLGGEGRINITITKATIDLVIQQPELNAYDIGSKMNIKVMATYPNSSMIPGPVMASYNGNNITLELINESFIGSYTLTPEDDGLSTLVISYTDDNGNTGTVSKKITAQGLITYYLMSNLWYIIIGIIAISLIIYFSQKKIVTASTYKKLKEKKEELIDNKKRLQEDYYVNESIDKESYETEISKIDEELNITKSKIKDYQKKNKKSK